MPTIQEIRSFLGVSQNAALNIRNQLEMALMGSESAKIFLEENYPQMSSYFNPSQNAITNAPANAPANTGQPSYQAPSFQSPSLATSPSSPTGALFSQPYNGLAQSASGSNPVFSLPQNFTFDDLAAYEEQARKKAAQEMQDKLAARRTQLSESLNKQGQDLFSLSNPKILEDLNARGLFTSPTAVNQAQANALKEIALSNQKYLNEFDTAATNFGVASEQDALNNVLDLRRNELENRLAENQANREQSLAESLAQKQSRQSLLESLIGTGGSLAGIMLSNKAGGAGTPSGLLSGFGGTGVSNLFGGQSTPLGRALLPKSLLGTSSPFSPTASLKAGGFGGAAAGAGAGLLGASLGRNVFGGGNDLGSVAGGGLGYMVGGPIGAGVGSFLGTGAQRLGEQGYQGAQKVLGNTLASTIKPILNPVGAVKSISNSVKKVFCFDAMTPIEMSDGTIKPISEIELDEETKGGKVESIRISKTDDGTLFSYKGVLVTGSHAVKEDGKWIRVEDSELSQSIAGEEVVFSIVTDKHRVYSNGIEFADEHETDDYEYLDMEASLQHLNGINLAEVN